MVPRLPVPPGVEVEAVRLPSALQGLHPRGQGAPRRPRAAETEERRVGGGRGRRTRSSPEPASRAVAIAPGYTIGGGAPPLFFAGPCVIESREHALAMARRAEGDRARRPAPGSSSSRRSTRPTGPRRTPSAARGSRRASQILAAVKAETGLPLLSDIHEPAQAAAAARVLDVLQIPAFLSRQTDLIVAAARTGKPIHIKKGQFLAPDDMGHVVEKCRRRGQREDPPLRARGVLRLPQPRRGHARLPDDAGARLPRRLRRDALAPAAGRRQRDGRPEAVRAGARPSGGGHRTRWTASFSKSTTARTRRSRTARRSSTSTAVPTSSARSPIADRARSRCDGRVIRQGVSAAAHRDDVRLRRDSPRRPRHRARRRGAAPA